MEKLKIKYEAPSIEMVELEAQDVITASLVSNGKGSITVGNTTIEGEEGTFSGLFSDLF
ncbi:MAG: hypothetical protein IJF11_04075 [Clostridia bacterium]|nr:hypothetical protein [Clostridia bacterium]